ncbi:5-(carboxyamino)imidazole ribonucleotide synthase [Sutcliffiella rhizosphaerae]|uniref:N5-carboxyaminoimidazole ribonucleotide synthase n=1 Tax=Sutcliffiella rhizosphaerae TaxID=2880967 RepID=A0ABN8ADV7_9BACI|nr:5-(carboxyamino)imidazole ribonucleotide synthase [Sutcliffiella rhizosphaerae]CAG9621363.1 N5-carboxyaminoimidazole ribonucleotide synthase [Sutcliffiella rhizosphaerae]
MFKHIVPPATIGIIGGGQLGRMMAIPAKAMGYKIAVLDPTPNSPCGQLADVEITAPFNDLSAIKKLAELSDVITYEFENIDYDALTWLEKHAYLPQGSAVLKTTQHRITEKKAIEAAGLPVAPYKEVTSSTQLIEGIEELGFPSVLKTCRFGYDGKGQVVLRGEKDIERAAQLLQNGECVLEKWIPFTKEISVVVARGTTGEMTTFPVGENEHRENILYKTIVPALIDQKLEKKALQSAQVLAKHLKLIGTLAVEMFVMEDGTIYINELAPRPHNSGHYTIDACETSQFEQHVRAITGFPLGKTSLWKPVVMVNLLGEHVDTAIEKIPNYENAKLHLYGKAEKKEKRKMGHINILADTIEQALEQEASWQIWQKDDRRILT